MHGAALGEKKWLQGVRTVIGTYPPFEVPADVIVHGTRKRMVQKAEAEWNAAFAAYSAAHASSGS